MALVVGLALMAAVSAALPLLALVLVILTRPHPRPLLRTFWLSAMSLNVAAGLVVLAIFRANGTVLGETSIGVYPGLYILVGCIALAAALLAATERGRAQIGREIEKGRHRGTANGSVGARLHATAEGVRARAQDSVGKGSLVFAVVIGLWMGLPTPFQVAAIGAIVHEGYLFPLQVALVAGVSLITYAVVEVPLVTYAVRPDATTARVAALSEWMDANKIQLVAGGAALVGVTLIVKGATSL